MSTRAGRESMRGSSHFRLAPYLLLYPRVMGESNTKLKFKRPPVRSVRLVFYLRSADHLTADQIGGLYEVWRPEYPEVVQSPPRAPVAEDPRAVAFVGEDDYWPLPFTEMENPKTGQTLFFQDDRFGIVWNFDPDLEEAPEYPGFDQLSRELLAQFERFCEAVKRSGGGELTVNVAECSYTNEIPDMAIDRYAYGILTKWSGADYESDPALRDGVGFSRHYHFAEDPNKPIWVSAVALAPDTGMRLWITTHVASDDSLDPDVAIQTAHENLMSTFLNWTSDEMRHGWGEQQT